MDGGEGFIGPNYLVLYPVKKLLEYNQKYSVKESAPGLFIIGSNGGGEVIGFDYRDEIWSIVTVPYIPLEMKYAVPIAPTFENFFERYSRFEL
jgi:hypothetical protein